MNRLKSNRHIHEKTEIDMRRTATSYSEGLVFIHRTKYLEQIGPQATCAAHLLWEQNIVSQKSMFTSCAHINLFPLLLLPLISSMAES